MIYAWSDDLRCLEKLINNLTALQSRIASWETWCSHQQDLTRGGDIMTISILYAFCGLLLAISVLAEDELHCPDDYVAVMAASSATRRCGETCS
ncbi:hypothetical protein V1264_020931 [Littorina saxatilis]|uniref:Uncharacterized protein n=1 Tax=Littorina saxatilis TaxID=31220 RepID=A0AAN9BB58_9CAEN